MVGMSVGEIGLSLVGIPPGLGELDGPVGAGVSVGTSLGLGDLVGPGDPVGASLGLGDLVGFGDPVGILAGFGDLDGPVGAGDVVG